jgi:uncharacterized protein (DUF1501 family)
VSVERTAEDTMSRRRLPRRDFVQLGAGALLGAGLGVPRAAASHRPRVLCIHLDGGLDGLSLLPPRVDPSYGALRPTTAVSSPIALDAAVGLHPALAPLERYYRRDELLALTSVGLSSAGTGRGHARARVALHAALREHVGAAPQLELAAALPPGCSSRVLHVRGSYPASVFGARLARVADAIASDCAFDAVLVPLGGFDTHLAQRARLAPLLGELAQGLAALWDELGAARRELVVIVVSEQGRTLAENCTAGTEDGHAGAALLLGASIAGGRVLAPWPALSALRARAQRSLPVEIDLARVLRELSQPSVVGQLGLFRREQRDA